jgi:hypothetical protein
VGGFLAVLILALLLLFSMRPAAKRVRANE